jgi:hypothetical protein
VRDNYLYFDLLKIKKVVEEFSFNLIRWIKIHSWSFVIFMAVVKKKLVCFVYYTGLIFYALMLKMGFSGSGYVLSLLSD